MTPVLTLVILRHPDSVEAAAAAEALRERFVSQAVRDFSAGLDGVRLVEGLPDKVLADLIPPASPPGSPPDSLPGAVAVVVLLDLFLAGDPAQLAALDRLAGVAARNPHRLGLFPVSLYKDAFGAAPLLGAKNFIRWHEWDGGRRSRRERLVRAVALGCCRLLRALLALRAQAHDPCVDPVVAFEAPVRLFLSHSKHDRDGVPMVVALRDGLHREPGFASFFDLNDIPAGATFADTLTRAAGRDVLVALITDSYVEREWCRREVLAARSAGIPLVVVDALTERAGRLLPWLGNCPVLRVEPEEARFRLPLLLDTVLDQLLRHLLWQALVGGYAAPPVKGRGRSRPAYPVRFVARQPDLLDLLDPGGGPATGVLVHPGLPVPAEERDVLRRAAPGLTVMSYLSWLIWGPHRGTGSHAIKATKSGTGTAAMLLTGRTIALSVSDPPAGDPAARAAGALPDVFTILAGQLLGEGARLIYGGDLRKSGFTGRLTALVARYADESPEAAAGVLVTNPLAWPVHISQPWEELADRARTQSSAARMDLLDISGNEMTLEARRDLDPRPATDQEWRDGLTAMRRSVAQRADAAILLGGPLTGSKGRMPGLAEEALCAMAAGRPVFLLGGFGGCTAALCRLLGLLPADTAAPELPPEAAAELGNCTPDSLNNGLDETANRILATSTDPSEIVTLVLQGLAVRLGG
jgi:hypothetical protein